MCLSLRVQRSYLCDPVASVSCGLLACSCLTAVVPRWISQRQAQSALLAAAWTKVSWAPAAGPQEKSCGERLSLRLVCGETSQEKELWHFAAAAAEQGTCEFLGESFSLWWSVNKHKMRVSFGLGFYSQMNEFE